MIFFGVQTDVERKLYACLEIVKADHRQVFLDIFGRQADGANVSFLFQMFYYVKHSVKCHLPGGGGGGPEI